MYVKWEWTIHLSVLQVKEENQLGKSAKQNDHQMATTSKKHYSDLTRIPPHQNQVNGDTVFPMNA